MNESVQRGLKLLNPGSVVPVDVKTVADLYNALDYTVKQNEKREWVGLTEDEAIELLPVGNWEIEPTLEFAKVIEQSLKEKNT